ncbi:hypothetical protein L3Y34_011383 [Caenorhabditis briggsae]|uniref:Uncharacterized protein n=1 Tax=Caenorhabditis briggsae TaxID=6238 RepID=A0AAE8ZQ10_CAEBR|nr:hypothetical protein L3Y34_011383 [Caenorhabditis briggsae]
MDRNVKKCMEERKKFCGNTDCKWELFWTKHLPISHGLHPKAASGIGQELLEVNAGLSTSHSTENESSIWMGRTKISGTPGSSKTTRYHRPS